MYAREPSLPSWESLREPSEASIDDEEDEEDEEDEIRATPAPGLTNPTPASTARRATTASSSSSTTATMHPPALPRLAGSIQPPQKRKESEGRADDPAVKRAKRDPISTNRRPSLVGFQSGTLGASSTTTNRKAAGQSHQRRASSGSTNTQNPGSSGTGTSKASKPAMPPPSMPPRGVQIEPSTSSSTLASTAPEPPTRKPPSADFRMADIPSSLNPNLFASAAEKKRKAEAARNSAAPSTSSSSTVNPFTTQPQPQSPLSPSKSQVPAEIIDITSSDSDLDLPALPPSAKQKLEEAKAKGKEKAKEVESISASAPSRRPLSSASVSASTDSPVRGGRTKMTARKNADSRPRSKPKPKRKPPPPGADVIELTDSSDDYKKKKVTPSATAAASQQSRKVADPGLKAAANKALGKDGDRMDVDPPPPSIVSAVSKTSQPVARVELSAKPTEILKFTPSPPIPVAVVHTPLNRSTQMTTAAADAGVKASAPLKFTPPSPAALTKTTRTTSLQSVNPTSSTSSKMPGTTRSQPSLPTASFNIAVPADSSASSSNGPKPTRNLDSSRNTQPSMPTPATPATIPANNSSTPISTSKALNLPRKHKHSLALKVTGMNKRYQSKFPVQKSVTPTTDAPEPESSKSPETSSNESASRSASIGQIDMRDLDTALGLPMLPSRKESLGNAKGKEKEKNVALPMASGFGAGMKEKPVSSATTKSPAKPLSHKSSGGQENLQKFVANDPKRPSLSGTGTSVETAIDLTSDVDDADSGTPVDAQQQKGPAVHSSRSGTDEPTAHPPLQLSTSPLVTTTSLFNSSSPPPDSAMEDPLTPLLPEAGTPILKDAHRQSAPTLGEASKPNDVTEMVKTSSALSSLAQLKTAASQSLPTTPAADGIITPRSPLNLTTGSGNTTLVASTTTTTITTQVTKDSGMEELEIPQPRRSLSGVEADEVEQALVQDLDNISMKETGMSLDSDADDLPDSQTTIMPLRTRRRQIMSPGSEENESTASGPSTSTRSSRRSSRLSKISSGTGSPPSDGNLFEHDDAAQKSPQSSRETSPEVFAGTPFTTATLGGFPAFQFATYRKNPKSYPKVYHSSDLQTSLHDQMNSLRGPIAAHPDLRDVYEATILQNTADDEPNAPPIAIRNDIDDEPTPPWNFYYTNKMWHGEGVPDPDIKNLKGCECKGKCNSKSKKCACAVKNQQVQDGAPNGYDPNGMLLSAGPVFECNSMCGCDEDCYNRVVQQGRKYDIAIQKTRHKGWGIFNGKTHIPKFRFIGIYSGEILTDKEAHKRGLYYNAAGITYLFDIDFYWVKERRKPHESVYVVDAFHAGNFTRFLNHSCDPNCRLYPIFTNEGSDQKPLLAVFSIKDIQPREEICFNYQGNYPGDEDDGLENPAEEEEKEKNNADDVIYKKCQCGAANCTGAKIFN